MSDIKKYGFDTRKSYIFCDTEKWIFDIKMYFFISKILFSDINKYNS